MSTYVCEQPGGDVVVFHGSRETVCPLCKAEGDINELKQQIEDLEGERDSLRLEVEGENV